MSRVAVGVAILILAIVCSIGAGAAFLLDQYGRVTTLEEHVITIDRFILGKPGATGPAGKTKTITIIEKGSQGLPGPQGAKGDRGSQGPKGNRGPRGIPGRTLTIRITKVVTVTVDNTKTHTVTTPGHTTTITTPRTNPCPPRNPRC